MFPVTDMRRKRFGEGKGFVMEETVRGETVAQHQLPLHCVKMHFVPFDFTANPATFGFESDFTEGRCCSRKEIFR